jgi:hypothetical protein
MVDQETRKSRRATAVAIINDKNERGGDLRSVPVLLLNLVFEVVLKEVT